MMRGYIMGFVTAVLVLVAMACNSTSQANKSQTDYTDRQVALLERGQPLHLYDYSQDRASYLAIYDARVQGKATYSVSVPHNGGGRGWYECPSRGYPIPASSELTNPQRIDYSSGGTPEVVQQAEPNGLYTGNTDGTYMQCVDSDGSLYTVYSEPPVLTFPFAVVWKGDHYEKANPTDRASFALPTAPNGQNNAPVTFSITPTPGR